jgi:hypothetical protein
MSSSKRLSISSLAAGGAFLLLLGVWSFSINGNGYIESATGLFLIATAIFRYLKENKKEQKALKALNREEE